MGPPVHHPVLTAFPTTHPAILGADATAIGVAAATFMGYLPSVAAILSIIWLIIQIVSSIDNWIHRKDYRVTKTKKKVTKEHTYRKNLFD